MMKIIVKVIIAAAAVTGIAGIAYAIKKISE